jgi:MOSC domain-containing protein YiiM
VQPGVQLTLGPVQLEVTGFATPCSNIAGSFADGRLVHMSQKVNPGWSRVYARVLVEGLLTTGDPVALVPTDIRRVHLGDDSRKGSG